MTHKLYINAYFIIFFVFSLELFNIEQFLMRHGAQFKTQHSKLNILFSRPFRTRT